MQEVGFSQQAAGLIPGILQSEERDHGNDIPTLKTQAEHACSRWLWNLHRGVSITVGVWDKRVKEIIKKGKKKERAQTLKF